jgi:hypothetical protein
MAPVLTICHSNADHRRIHQLAARARRESKWWMCAPSRGRRVQHALPDVCCGSAHGRRLESGRYTEPGVSKAEGSGFRYMSPTIMRLRPTRRVAAIAKLLMSGPRVVSNRFLISGAAAIQMRSCANRAIWDRTIRSRHFEVRRLLPILVIAASRPQHSVNPIVIVIVQTEKPHSTNPS